MKLGKWDHEWKITDKVYFYFKWYDPWILFYIKPDLTRIYFGFIPMLGFYFKLKKA